MNRRNARLTAWLAIGGMLAGVSSVTASPEAGSGRALLEQLVEVLATGDQAAYEQFVQEHYAPAALADYDAEDHAASLARIYTDTGGLTLERFVGETSGWLQAEARDRIIGIRYCLTLERSQTGNRDLITDFNVRALFPSGPALGAPTAGELVHVIEALAQKYHERELFSGVILIAREDEILFRKAYGRASIAYQVPMTLATRLNIASIGKMLTGVAIAQLADAGKLSYDDTLGKVLPDYPDQNVREAVTVRQLLSHTSGLGPKDYYEGPLWAALRPHLRSVPDYMRLVVGTPIGSEPGQYRYSNSGYVLLGAVVERLSGQSYYDYVHAHIFGPAGMTRSFYHELDREDPDVAVPLTNLFNKDEGYVYRLGPPRNATYELAAKGGPQGGAFATADDLFAFAKALRDGKLVSAARFREMTTANSPSGAGAGGLAGDVREGLGVEVIQQNGHTFLGHTGGDLGVASMLYWYPETGYTTIILSNRDPRAARVMTNATRALLTRQTLNGATPPAQGCVAPPASGQ